MNKLYTYTLLIAVVVVRLMTNYDEPLPKYPTRTIEVEVNTYYLLPSVYDQCDVWCRYYDDEGKHNAKVRLDYVSECDEFYKYTYKLEVAANGEVMIIFLDRLELVYKKGR